MHFYSESDWNVWGSVNYCQPLITARLVFAPKAFPPPPIIGACMEFPSINVHQQYECLPSPEIRTPRKHSLAPPKRQHTTPKRASTPQKVPKRNMDVNLETPHRHTASRHPMPIDTQRTVAFEDDGPLMPLSDEDDELESEEDGEVGKIPKPPGEASHPQSGGYRLQEKLGWNERTYQSITVSLLNKLWSILTKLTESGVQTCKDEIKHHNMFS